MTVYHLTSSSVVLPEREISNQAATAQYRTGNMIRSYLIKTVSSHRLSFLRLVNTTTASIDHAVNFYREENTLIVKLPSILSPSPPITAPLSPIKPFVLHPVLSHPFVTLDVQSLTNEQATDRIISIIEHHYELKDGSGQFVGSMGENDGGVWFLGDGDCMDTLDHWDIIQDIISSVKESRHGIPFGIYSSGRAISNLESEKASILESELGLSHVEVTLGAGEPSLYMELVASNDLPSTQKEFNRTCNFIATAAEAGIPISVGVASGKFTASGTALGKALGASNINMYP